MHIPLQKSLVSSFKRGFQEYLVAMTCKAEDKKIRVVRIQLQYVRFFCQANPEVQVHWWWLLVSRTFSMAQTNKFYARLKSCPIGNTMHVYQQMCSCIHLNKLTVLYFKKKRHNTSQFFFDLSSVRAKVGKRLPNLT